MRGVMNGGAKAMGTMGKQMMLVMLTALSLSVGVLTPGGRIRPRPCEATGLMEQMHRNVSGGDVAGGDQDAAMSPA